MKMTSNAKEAGKKPGIIEKPLLIGLNHNDSGLSLRARRLVEKFGKPGKTLFVEGSLVGLQHPTRPDSFEIAIQIAQKMGMNLVPLDSPRIGKIKRRITEPDDSIDLEKAGLSKLEFRYQKAGLSKLEFRYLMSNVRERGWIKTIQTRCRAGDLVLMHQNHLSHIVPELQKRRFPFSYIFASRPHFPEQMGSLSKTEIRKMKQIRNKRRPIRYKGK